MTETKIKLKRVKINVTREDIDNGIREDCQSCPVGKALMRQLYLSDVDVNGGVIALTSHKLTDYEFVVHNIPQKIQTFIGKFDNLPNLNEYVKFKENRKMIDRIIRSEIKPFSFTISVPSVLIRGETQ